MMKIRKASERGHVDLGWLQSYHSFSFGDYVDPEHMGFSNLRVINDDQFSAGSGFPIHSHRDMEIITLVMAGCVAHKDSIGSSGEIRPGEIQIMTAGSGIQHSEFAVGPVACEMFQIWIKPIQSQLTPSYRQLNWQRMSQDGQLKPEGGSLVGELDSFSLLASKAGRNGSAVLNADADLYLAEVHGKRNLQLSNSRKWYLQNIHGSLELQMGDAKPEISGRDAIGISPKGLDFLNVTIQGNCSFLLFDLPN